MKIYTKTGDKGKTSLLTGKRVSKNHPRIEAYGSIDELNSFIGLLRSNALNANDSLFLEQIQNNLFSIGSLLAMDEKRPEFGLKEINPFDIQQIENEIDEITLLLPKLKSFIIPGGSQAIASCHVCRSVCRRAERHCIQLDEFEAVEPNIIIYLNRLSDYFFMLARKVAFENKIKLPEWKNSRQAK
jgi:cob(I)alamin adenosyltransferase